MVASLTAPTTCTQPSFLWVRIQCKIFFPAAQDVLLVCMADKIWVTLAWKHSVSLYQPNVIVHTAFFHSSQLSFKSITYPLLICIHIFVNHLLYRASQLVAGFCATWPSLTLMASPCWQLGQLPSLTPLPLALLKVDARVKGEGGGATSPTMSGGPGRQKRRDSQPQKM